MSAATHNKVPSQLQYQYISVVLNEFRNSYTQQGDSQEKRITSF